MKKILKLILCASIFLSFGCNDKENTAVEFTLTNDLSSQIFHGFSFRKMDTITFPNSENIIPDLMVVYLINDFGDISGPFLSHQNAENRFALIGTFENRISAQDCFDTISCSNNSAYQSFTPEIKPYEIWQVKTTTEEVGVILILEARVEKIGSGGIAEMKFKAKKFLL